MTTLAALLHTAITGYWTRGCGGTHMMGYGDCQQLAARVLAAGVRVGDAQQNVSVNPSPDAGLREAAQAVVDIWDAGRHPATVWVEYIAALRAALAGEEQP